MVRKSPALAVIVVVLSTWPGIARAQSPRLAVGFDASARAGKYGTPAAYGPHLTFNFSPQADIEVIADVKTNRQTWSSKRWSDSRTYFVQSRRAGAQQSGFTAAILFGLGVIRDDQARPETTRIGSNSVVEQRLTKYTSGVLAVGVGVQRTIAATAAVRADLNMMFTSRGMQPRVLTGISVPIGGRYIKPVEHEMFAGSAPFRTGQYVWITTDGGEVSGHVTALTRSGIEVRTETGTAAVSVFEVRRVEVPDSLANGTKIGAASGALAVGGVVALTTLSRCSRDCGFGFAYSVIMCGAGAGVGAVLDAWIDLANEHRQVLFDRAPKVSLRPVVAPKLAGMEATIRW